MLILLRSLLVLLLLLAGMDGLPLRRVPWEGAVLSRDRPGENCSDPDCRFCLSQMAFPVVARMGNWDKNSSQPIHTELMDREAHYLPEDTLHVEQVLWMKKSVAVGRLVASTAGTAAHQDRTVERVKYLYLRIWGEAEVQVYARPCRDLPEAGNTVRNG